MIGNRSHTCSVWACLNNLRRRKIEDIAGKLKGPQGARALVENHPDHFGIGRYSGGPNLPGLDESFHSREQIVLFKNRCGRGVKKEEVDIIRPKLAEAEMKAFSQ